MFGTKMTDFIRVIALLSAFATSGMAQSYTDVQSTGTLPPSPLGTTTSDGALLVSMNYCSVVINTQCQVSVMTSAAAPASASTADTITTSHSPSTYAAQSTEMPSSSYSNGITESASTASSSPPMTTTALTAAAAGITALPGAALGAAILAVAALL